MHLSDSHEYHTIFEHHNYSNITLGIYFFLELKVSKNVKDKNWSPRLTFFNDQKDSDDLTTDFECR